MSSMIECDSCKKKMYADSRSKKGDYHDLWIDQQDHYHLCRECYEKMLEAFFPEAYAFLKDIEEDPGD